MYSRIPPIVREAHRVREAARLTGVSEATLRRLGDRGVLRVYRDAAGVQVVDLPADPADVRAMLRRKRGEKGAAKTEAPIVSFPIDMSRMEQLNAFIGSLTAELERKSQQHVDTLLAELERKNQELDRLLTLIEKLTTGTHFKEEA